MKLKLIIIIFFSLPLISVGQKNYVLLDAYSSATINCINHLQSGMRILVSIPTKKDWLGITSESFVLDQGFGQSLIGTEFKVSKSLFISTLIGISNNPENPFRLGTSARYISPKIEGLLVYQWGPKTDYFYIAKWTFKVKNFNIGARSQRFLNTGIYLNYHLNKILSIWSQVGKDFELKNNTIALGISGKF
ncbi:MAG: hypothetical protein JKY48_02815 [Flavobacteriales bacterium]|nr:hypothetical protein [Flavobacteriales bacterium]